MQAVGRNVTGKAAVSVCIVLVSTVLAFYVWLSSKTALSHEKRELPTGHVRSSYTHIAACVWVPPLSSSPPPPHN